MATFPSRAHVVVTVSDLDRSTCWHGDPFGAEPVLDQDETRRLPPHGLRPRSGPLVQRGELGRRSQFARFNDVRIGPACGSRGCCRVSAPKSRRRRRRVSQCPVSPYLDDVDAEGGEKLSTSSAIGAAPLVGHQRSLEAERRPHIRRRRIRAPLGRPGHARAAGARTYSPGNRAVAARPCVRWGP